MRERAVLNALHEEAYEAKQIDPKAKRSSQEKAKAQQDAQKRMCENFFDVRTFGAVMTTGEADCGQVRGPLQLTFARSIDPIVAAEFSITRCAVTNEKDAEKERKMGRKFTVPYGLYRCHGFINPTLAEKTGFSEEDLGLIKGAFNEMFEVDHSSARGLMAPVRCIAFRHDNKLGNARADELFSLVTVEKRPELQAENLPPRSRNDYVISLREPLPEGITAEEWVSTRWLVATT